MVVPAESAYRYSYDALDVVPTPAQEGPDYTYVTRIGRAADYFFHIPDGTLPWIAALDGDGKGLVQLSTPRLKGRKLFLWGMGRGGRKWQEFLSVGGQPYLEIQAGLARTQLEHVPMPANTEWDWLEAYGLLEAPAELVHAAPWADTRAAVGAAVEQLLPRSRLEAELVRSRSFAAQPPVEIFQHGSGWGALERLRRAKMGEPPFAGAGLPFAEESLGTAQSCLAGTAGDGHVP